MIPYRLPRTFHAPAESGGAAAPLRFHPGLLSRDAKLSRCVLFIVGFAPGADSSVQRAACSVRALRRCAPFLSFPLSSSLLMSRALSPGKDPQTLNHVFFDGKQLPTVKSISSSI